MGTKIQRLKKWLCDWLCDCNKKPVSRITQHANFELETFEHEGYSIEIRRYPDGDVQINAFLKGQKCLEGSLLRPNEFIWAHSPDAESVPSYRVRLYLKHYALQRNKE